MKKNNHTGIHKLLIANRGEIARRILKACREKNISVAVIATEEDKNSLVCGEADTVLIVDSFLNAKQIIQQAKKWGSDLLHPGYGFLSENAEFSALCEDNGISFIGPTSTQIKLLGSKESSKNIAKACHIPTLPSLSSLALKQIPFLEWQSKFKELEIHPPYLIKASGGGGGRGMRIIHNIEDIPNALTHASHEALQAFNDETVFVERYVKYPRHIEIQVFGDGKGGGVFLGERECSLQRRHQKVIEECPSSMMTPELREQMGEACLAILAHTKYRGAGTVEFLFDENKIFYFLEMNTRLQVEHPVTEMVYGIDLVHAQIDLALGQWQEQKVKPAGVAIEARILAENPRENFLPTPGKIEEYKEPKGDGIRIDSGVTKGSFILPSFDSMIAKLIVHAPDRVQAISKMQYALKNYLIFGITTNIPFLIALVSRKEFLEGKESTQFIEEHLTELNKKIIPKNLIDFFESFACREKLFSGRGRKLNPAVKPRDDTNPRDDTQKNTHIFARQKFHNNNETTFDLSKIHFIPFINSKNQMEINIDGEIILLEHPGYYNQNFLTSHETSSEIKSPMAGKVYEVLIKKGDHVKKSELLFIIESMKIQLEVRAPHDGIVNDICVSKGEILMGPNKLAIITNGSRGRAAG